MHVYDRFVLIVGVREEAGWLGIWTAVLDLFVECMKYDKGLSLESVGSSRYCSCGQHSRDVVYESSRERVAKAFPDNVRGCLVLSDVGPFEKHLLRLWPTRTVDCRCRG